MQFSAKERAGQFDYSQQVALSFLGARIVALAVLHRVGP